MVMAELHGVRQGCAHLRPLSVGEGFCGVSNPLASGLLLTANKTSIASTREQMRIEPPLTRSKVNRSP